ncbi:hypothetical protein ALC57_13059 [Trachymyrmex cornetzi]|uniref:Uncharacterized protein n=1 Tax=Trachymyrmex cornetzi TaxID=471704 RepID=A0A151IZX2_9HYME|nr:hypothetical protein ALC57_13059 [Trachymyrmex cornetzi]
MATYQPQTPRGEGSAWNGDTADNPQVTSGEVNREIRRLREAVGEPRVTPTRDRQEEILDRLIDAITGLQDRVSRMEITNCDRENFRLVRPDNGPEELHVTYGRDLHDVRELRDRLTGYLRLKDARRLIPEIDGSIRNKTQEFITARQRFDDKTTVENNATSVLKTIPKSEFQDCFEKWKHRWNRVIQSSGDYFEGCHPPDDPE